MWSHVSSSPQKDSQRSGHSLSFLGSHLPGTFAVFSTSHSRELRLPWTELLLMEQKHLQIIILMSLAGLIIKHNVGSVLKLLCLVSWGLYSNASSKDIGRGGCEGQAVTLLFQKSLSPILCAINNWSNEVNLVGNRPEKLDMELQDSCYHLFCSILGNLSLADGRGGGDF